MKAKQELGIPDLVKRALMEDGWICRSTIIWHKPNAMPESVTDRPARSHEYIFLLAKSERYWYDAKAIAEPTIGQNLHDITGPGYLAPGQTKQKGNRSGNRERKLGAANRVNSHLGSSVPWEGSTRNKRDVWTVATEPFPESHFAVFPSALIEPCILAGCPPGGVVLDPFGGAGTTTLVAMKHNRNSIYIDLNPEYREMAIRRCGFGDTLLDCHSWERVS